MPRPGGWETLLYTTTIMHSLSYLAHFFLEWEIFLTETVEKIKTRFTFNNFFFFKNVTVYEIMWKKIVQPYRPQMTICCLRNACWITKATHTLRICDTYCFYATTLAARTRLVVTLYVYWLSCFNSRFPCYRGIITNKILASQERLWLHGILWLVSL